MTTTSTIISDNADMTVTQIVDDVAQCTTIQTTFKPGSQGFNQQAMQTKMAAALSALEFADANWATITAQQRLDATQLAVRCTAKLIRFALGRFDAN